MIRPALKLYTKIVLLMLIVGFIPLIVISIFYFTNIEGIVRRSSHQALTSLADEVGKEIKRSVNDGYQNILLLTENPVITSSTASYEEKREELIKTQKFHRIFKDISLLNTDGQVLASVLYSFRGTWTSTEWFKSALKGRTVISDVHAVLYPFEIVITITSPIRNREGGIRGVLVGQLDMENIWKITENVSAGKGGQVWMIDHRGVVIASPDQNQLLEPIMYESVRKAAMGKKRGISYLEGSKVAVYTPIIEESDKFPVWSILIIQPHQEIYAALYSIRLGLILATIGCLAMVIILVPLLSHQISDRVTKLVEMAGRLGQGDFSAQVENLGNDEIGELAKVFNWAGNQIALNRQKILEYSEHLEELVEKRTDELKTAQVQLIETAHLAGMAEVASEILHNIGNAINSTNIRLNLVLERINKLEIKRPLQAVDIIKSNYGHLDTFLNEDNRGQKVIPYLELALHTMADNRNEILADLNFLHEQVTHICEIITLQQSYAKGKGKMHEKCELDKILANSISMLSDVLQKNGVRIETQFSYHKPILSEPHQLLQVFVNIIKNAVQSIVSQKSEYRVIYISTEGIENNGRYFLEISIKDTGAGFPQELKNKIFSYGFSTKGAGGKGFGLHFCANYIQSIGGNIMAESKGLGEGAEFIIQIPIEGIENSDQRVSDQRVSDQRGLEYAQQ